MAFDTDDVFIGVDVERHFPVAKKAWKPNNKLPNNNYGYGGGPAKGKI